MWPFNSSPVVPVLRLSGAIGMATPLKPGLSIATLSAAIDKTFSMSKLPSVALLVNSPGGSPVQSSLILKRIRQLAEEKEKKVYVFCEDVAASGGYYIALAGDEIYADTSSIIGSIGVISAGFGFEKAIEKLGVERRVYTAGTSKSMLDPFRPENPADVARLKQVQQDVHDAFIGVVKDRRAGKLTGHDDDLFNGSFWSAPKALDLGLIDGVTDVRTKMRELHGEKVKLKLVPISSGGLLSRLRRVSLGASDAPLGLPAGNLAEDMLSTLETRALWSRFGL